MIKQGTIESSVPRTYEKTSKRFTLRSPGSKVKSKMRNEEDKTSPAPSQLAKGGTVASVSSTKRERRQMKHTSWTRERSRATCHGVGRSDWWRYFIQFMQSLLRCWPQNMERQRKKHREDNVLNSAPLLLSTFALVMANIQETEKARFRLRPS